MAFDADRYPHEIHFYLASLEDASGLEPQFHVFVAEKVAWVELGDGLPKYQEGVGGPRLDGLMGEAE